jgi:hypothetical protein
VRAGLDTHVHVPAWLAAEHREAFRERAHQAFARWAERRGWAALTPFMQGRILGGLAAAFKYRRLDRRWGRRMLARRGGQARLQSIAMAGEQKRAYFTELGRLGGRRAAAARRWATAHPHVRQVLRPRRPPPRHWMAL